VILSMSWNSLSRGSFLSPLPTMHSADLPPVPSRSRIQHKFFRTHLPSCFSARNFYSFPRLLPFFRSTLSSRKEGGVFEKIDSPFAIALPPLSPFSPFLAFSFWGWLSSPAEMAIPKHRRQRNNRPRPTLEFHLFFQRLSLSLFLFHPSINFRNDSPCFKNESFSAASCKQRTTCIVSNSSVTAPCVTLTFSSKPAPPFPWIILPCNKLSGSCARTSFRDREKLPQSLNVLAVVFDFSPLFPLQVLDSPTLFTPRKCQASRPISEYRFFFIILKLFFPPLPSLPRDVAASSALMFFSLSLQWRFPLLKNEWGALPSNFASVVLLPHHSSPLSLLFFREFFLVLALSLRGDLPMKTGVAPLPKRVSTN